MRPWSLWSSCSKTCNSGQSRRGRVVETQPQHNGTLCPVLDGAKSCNDFPCPIDCQVKHEISHFVITSLTHLKTAQVSAWSAWSSCSKSCNWGGRPGQSRKGRTVVTQPENGGVSCPVLDGTKSCNDFHCPKHCEVHRKVNP